MEKFNWQPDWDMETTKKANVVTVKFEDYEQRQTKGISGVLRQISLTFTGNEQKIRAIDRFLSKQNGVNAFLFTPYNEVEGKFKCEEWSKTTKTGFFTLKATFIEVFA